MKSLKYLTATLVLLGLSVVSFSQTNSTKQCEFVKLSDKKSSELTKKEPAFSWKGQEYRIHRSRLYYINEAGKTKGVVNGTVYEMMTGCPEIQNRYKKGITFLRIGGVSTLLIYPLAFPMLGIASGNMKHAVDDFYDIYMDSVIKACDSPVASALPVKNDTKELAQTSVQSQEENEIVQSQEESEIVQSQEIEKKQEESKSTVGESPKQEVAAKPAVDEKPVVKEQPKEEPKKVKEPKPEREHLEKLNIRKKNGYGLFADAGGFITRGPRLGMEFRFNRCMPSVFVGYPTLGMMFKKDYEECTSLKSISAGAGCKGLVPARWGGFYAGGYVQYNRLSAESAVGTYYEQKILDNCIDVMAGVGFRFQFKCNLFFNLGGYAGPAINMRSFRYSNILYNDYSPTYQSGDTEIKVKGNAELSIGYEF